MILLLAFIDMTDRTPKPKGAELRQALRESLDLMGLVLFAPAMIMLFLALQYGGNQYPWKSATVIGLFCGFGGMLAVFLLWESRRGAHAMFPFAIVGQRTVWSSCLSSFFIAGVTVSGAYYLPIYFQAVEGNSPIRSGVYFLPNILPQVTFSLFTGGLSKPTPSCSTLYFHGANMNIVMAWGYYLPSVVSGCVLASIGYGLLTMLTPGYSIAKRVGYQIIVGVGIGSATSVVSCMMMDTCLVVF